MTEPTFLKFIDIDQYSENIKPMVTPDNISHMLDYVVKIRFNDQLVDGDYYFGGIYNNMPYYIRHNYRRTTYRGTWRESSVVYAINDSPGEAWRIALVYHRDWNTLTPEFSEKNSIQTFYHCLSSGLSCSSVPPENSWYIYTNGRHHKVTNMVVQPHVTDMGYIQTTGRDPRNSQPLSGNGLADRISKKLSNLIHVTDMGYKPHVTDMGV